MLEALLVTVLWSSSYVFIKIGLQDIPPLTFAGLRYGLATLVLLPFVFRQGAHREVAALSRRDFGILVVLGVLLYAVTQGAQFVALTVLTSASVSLVLTSHPSQSHSLGASASESTRRFGRSSAYSFSSWVSPRTSTPSRSQRPTSSGSG